ncbi:MAG: YadA-like family protein [Veillonella sp.]|uniref:YadA-like family protein n=1 Tax=Veillonella sp. TaxID=1926307 RepID=UPI00290BDB2D|nr:YadA-like family protein [Veillonella sp.]MDU7212452.1 YadA-like family protein [Veillonella sp.]
MKYNDGNGATQAGTIAKIDLSGLADQIKDGYSFSTDAKGNVVGNHAVTAVANGKTVSYAAGDNLTVKQDIDATTGEHTYTYALSNDIKVGKDGKDGIDGKIGVNGKDGSSVVINGKDGSIGLNGKDGKDGLTIRGEKGQDGVDGKNGTNGITRIVYEDHNHDKHEVATLDDGMKYAGDDAQGADKSKVIAKKLNETMDVVGGADKSKLTDNNIGVNNVDGKLKVQLSKEVNLTPSGSLTIGDTIVNNNGLTISGGPSIIKTGINAGNLNITNVKAGVNDTDAVNVKQLKDARTVVTSNDNSVTVNKTENGNQVTYDLHVAPGAAQSVWNVKSTGNTTADSETAAKTISDGKTVEMAAGKNLTVKQTSNNDGAKVEFDLANDIKIGKDGKDGVDGKIGVNGKDGSSVVINGKDGSIGLNGKDGKDGLTMKGEKGADGVTRIVYEDNTNNKHEVATLDDGLRFDANSGGEKKNKLGSKVTVKGTGTKADSEYDSSNIKTSITQGADGNSEINIGLAKDLNNINTIKNGGNATFTIGGDNFAFNGGNVSLGGNNITNLKSGVVNNNDTDNTNAANIGDVKNISKANDIHVKDKTYTVNADKTVTLEYVDGNDNTINKTAKIDLSNLPTGDKAAVESVVKKSAAAGDTNIADITVADGKQTGDANAKYEVNVSRNAVKDAAREAVTVNTTNTTNNPITVTPVQDETNHNTTYTVTFDGNKAATQIPLTYKANGQNAQTVTLDKGLNAGNLNITNVKAGVNDTDAVNVKQLKDARTVVTSNDNSVTVNKTENGNQVTYDLHVAPGAAQSVWNVKSTGNTTADSETAAKTISDGKTVEMAAGKNLTVKQTSNNDGAKVEFDLANDIKIGKDGKDGVDGKIGVNGKDGSSVVINGKDGSIGLNGKDGKDGLTMKGEKGADGVTRIVYEDHDNNKHEVATLDDGLRFDANSGGEKKNKLGSKVTVKGTGAKADSEYDSSNIKTSITQGADGNSEINIGLAKDLNNINTIKNGGPATFTIGGNEFKFDGGNVNMGGNNITNLKSGIVNNNSTDDTNGANIGDVKTISKANDLHIAPTTSNRQGETTTSYAYDTASKSVTLKYNDGNGANQAGTIAKIDLSGLADQIKDGYSFSTDAKGNVVGNHAVTAVGNGKTVSYAAGDNLTIAQHIDNATGEQTYTYALSNDIKIGKDGKDGIDGKIGVNGKDGSSVVINGKDGSIGLNGKDGKDGLTMKAKDGQPGVNGKDGITRIVYEDNSKNTHEVATLDDGMKYAGDDAQGADKSKVIAKKLNETMDVVGGADKSKLTDNNIGVNNVDGKLKVQLSKEVNLTPSGSLTIGDTVVNNNGLTISGGPSITKTGINAGNKTIVNVDAGVNDTDAVNVQQLKKAKTEVKAGNNVTVDTTYGTDGHTIYTVNANDVALGDAVLKYSANGTNTQSVKLSQGLNFVDGNYTSASVDANGQVKYDVTIGKVKDGVDGKPGVDGKDGIATVKTVVDTINNSGWKGDVTGNTVNNHTATIVKPGTTVNFGAGKNLTVEQIVDKVTGDHTYNYALSDDIKVGKDGKDGVDGKIGVNGKDGSSVVINGKDGSIGLNGKDGKDGLTMKAKDGQPGVNGKDGITRIVYEDNSKNTHEVATLDDGMKYAGDDAQGTDKSKVIAKKLNQTMDIVGGANSTKLTDNNIGVNNVDGKLKVQLAQNIDLTPAGSLTIGGTSITDNGLVINQGPSITKGGINAGNKTIVNVAPGVNGTDAVNVNQLNSARTEVEEGDNVTVTSRTGANGQTIYKVSATGVNLGDAELKYSANGTNTQSVKLSKGLNFVDGNYTSASVDANGQVKYDVNLGNIKQGTDGKPGVDGKDGIATVKTVVDTINNSGWKANATGNVVGTSTATIVKPGSTVNYGAGKNLNVKQTVNGEEQTYEFALDKDLKELNSVQTNTIHLGSPTSHTTINYNAGNDRIEYTTKNGTKQVANLDDIWTIQANGTDVKPVGGKVNVVGGDHIKVSTDAAGKMTISADGVGTMNGFNVKSTGNTTNDSDKTAKNITDGKTVEFSGGKNLTVKQTNTGDGAKVEFALNNNIDLTPNGSVKIGDTVVNNDGLTITGGPTITKNNVDMGGQQIHNVKSGGDVDSNGANIGDIKRISKANDTRIKDGNYEVSQNGTVEMTYVDGSGKQLVDEHGNPVKATISGIARQDLSNITNEGKKVITGLGTIVKAGQNVSVDEATDNATGQKTYTVNADLSGAKVYAGVGTDGSGVAKGLKNPEKVEKGTQYIAGDNMVVERKHVDGDDKLDNSITYSLAHDLTEINSISNGGATLRINANPGGNKYDRDAAVTPALEVHGGNLSMTGNRIVNLAPGIDGTDGVNVNQLRDSLTTVKSTDGTVRVTDLSTDPNKHEYDLHVNPAADPRVDQLGEEIGHVGAQSAALSALKPIQYDPMEPTQIMAGYGNYRGNSALALGVAHYKNESTMFHAGVSWAGGNGHMMANAGVTWKVGNRDSEAAVADRYRKGPISSTYAMQTEVASMKAQNAGLKGEVSDLKAENEQIKAQNAGLQSEVDQLKAQMAAMMAKLGM